MGEAIEMAMRGSMRAEKLDTRCSSAIWAKKIALQTQLGRSTHRIVVRAFAEYSTDERSKSNEEKENKRMRI